MAGSRWSLSQAGQRASAYDGHFVRMRPQLIDNQFVAQDRMLTRNRFPVGSPQSMFPMQIGTIGYGGTRWRIERGADAGNERRIQPLDQRMHILGRLLGINRSRTGGNRDDLEPRIEQGQTECQGIVDSRVAVYDNFPCHPRIPIRLLKPSRRVRNRCAKPVTDRFNSTRSAITPMSDFRTFLSAAPIAARPESGTWPRHTAPALGNGQPDRDGRVSHQTASEGNRRTNWQGAPRPCAPTMRRIDCRQRRFGCLRNGRGRLPDIQHQYSRRDRGGRRRAEGRQTWQS